MKQLFIIACGLLMASAATANWDQTYARGQDQNHHSVKAWGEHTVVAGTVFDAGKLTNPNTHLMKLDDSGNIVWEVEHDFGEDERCLGLTVVSSELVAVTGFVGQTDGSNDLFIATFNSSGTLVNKRRISLDDGEESIGLDIHYSEYDGRYYIAGYESSDILSETSDKRALVVCIDDGLNLIWVKYVTASSGTQNMASNLVEMPGSGIFVTGRLDVDQSSSNLFAIMSLALDYSGSAIWDLSGKLETGPEVGVDAAYDANNERLYILTNNQDDHTFNVIEVANALTSSASVAQAKSNTLISNTGYNNFCAYDIELDPNGDFLLVGGRTSEKNYNGPLTRNLTPFMASLSKSTLGVTSLKDWDVPNVGLDVHDVDVLQCLYSNHAYINYPDIFEVVNAERFQMVSYRNIESVLELTIMESDNARDVTTMEDCQNEISADPSPHTLTAVEAILDEDSGELASFSSSTKERDVSTEDGCVEMSSCSVSITSFTSSYVDCYEYSFSVAATFSSNAVYREFIWDWGDGTSTTTPSTTTTQSHVFSNAACSYTVCVTAVAYGPNGVTCLDQDCKNQLMLVFGGCPSCGSSKRSAADVMGDQQALSLQAYPNPAKDQLTIEFTQVVEHAEVSITNLVGQQVMSQRMTNTHREVIDVSQLPAGSYIMVVNTADGRVTEMIVIE